MNKENIFDLNKTCVAYFLSTTSWHLLVAVAFPRSACAPADVAVRASAEIVLMTREKVVTWQQRLCPETTHAVLTAGEQNVTHGASAQRRGGEKKGQRQRTRGYDDVTVTLQILVSLCSDSTDSTAESSD